MATSSWGALLSFGLGLGAALLGVAARYGALDDLADLGMAVYSDYGNTIPAAVFTDYPSADGSGHFATDDSFRQRLASIPVPLGVSYAFPQVLPQRLDELLSPVPQP